MKKNMCMLSAVVLCGFCVSLASAETIVWWRFEEGSDGAEVTTVQDWSPDGTSEGPLSGGDPSGGPVYALTDHGFDVSGLSDRIALSMDGFDDYILNIPFVQLTFESTFSFECIINWAGPMQEHAEGFRAIDMILQQQDGIGTGRSLLYIATNELDETVIPTLTSYLGGVTSSIPEVEVPSNQWIYAGLTYEDGIMVLWMDTDLSDGVQPDANFYENFLDFEDNDGTMIIGRHKSLIDYFHGKISEFRITDSGFGDGPDFTPPTGHLQVTQAVSVPGWELF